MQHFVIKNGVSIKKPSEYRQNQRKNLFIGKTETERTIG
jgi:hypothetical protein